MRISDWSSDVCSSDLFRASLDYTRLKKTDNITRLSEAQLLEFEELFPDRVQRGPNLPGDPAGWAGPVTYLDTSRINAASARMRSEEHTSELQSLMRNSYAVFCLHKTRQNNTKKIRCHNTNAQHQNTHCQ